MDLAMGLSIHPQTNPRMAVRQEGQRSSRRSPPKAKWQGGRNRTVVRPSPDSTTLGRRTKASDSVS